MAGVRDALSLNSLNSKAEFHIVILLAIACLCGLRPLSGLAKNHLDWCKQTVSTEAPVSMVGVDTIRSDDLVSRATRLATLHSTAMPAPLHSFLYSTGPAFRENNCGEFFFFFFLFFLFFFPFFF